MDYSNPPRFFVRTEGLAGPDLGFDHFLLRPLQDPNDGYLTSFTLALVSSQGVPRESFGVVKIARPGTRLDVPVLDDGPFLRVGHNTFSLGQSYTYYELMLGLPSEFGRRALEALGDVVVDPARREIAESSAVFADSLLASSRARRALADAPRLLEQAARSDVPRKWSFDCQFPAHQLSVNFDFTETLEGVPDRMHVLVGDNGTGKSYLLAALARSIATDSRGTHDRARDSEGRDVSFSRVMTVAYGAFESYELPTADDDDSSGSSKRADQRYFYFGLRRYPEVATVSSLKSLEETQAELSRALGSLTEEFRRNALRNAVDLLRRVTTFPDETLATLSSHDLSGLHLDLRRLSSGQTMVLNVLVNLIAYLEPGSLVLIDEPETHLHPPLVSALIRGLSDTLEAFDSLAILATHSAVVAQEILSRNVSVVYRTGDVTAVAPPAIETYGESVGILNRELFGMNTVRTDFAEVLESNAGLGLDGMKQALNGRLSDQASAILISARERG
jgi:predicted ATPase